MRNLLTAAVAAIALSLGLAAPALADQNSNGPNNGQRYGQNYDDDRDDYGRRDQDQRRDGHRYDQRRGDRDFDRHERRFDTWERGWRHDGHQQWRHQQTLSHWQLIRRLERQGYYGVRGLRPARHGFGWRAFAYTGRGQPVMIRINPHNGRVIEVRRLWA